MTQQKGKGQNKDAKPIRNMRIVWLKDVRGMSFEEIRLKMLEEGHPMSRQAVANTYKVWKNVPFRFENDEYILH